MMNVLALTIASTFGLLIATGASAQVERTPVPRGDVTAPKKLPAKAGAKALTIAECTGLGGRVENSDASCEKKGQFTCKVVTATPRGEVVRTQCITR
jgi:hypothetical protein